MSDKAVTCPHCGNPAKSAPSTHCEESIFKKEEKVVQQSVLNAELKKEKGMLQQQVAALRQESSQLQETILANKNSFEQLRSEIETTKKELLAHQKSLTDVQSKIVKEQETLNGLTRYVQDRKNELEHLSIQSEIKHKTQRDDQGPSLGYKIAIWSTCIAIAATIGWILWMVITFN